MRAPRRVSGGLAALVALLYLLPPMPARANAPTHTITVLFTHDLHSHFLPRRTEDGGESGGCARLKTVLDRERADHPANLVVDGGDFSAGSLLQTLYTTRAAELRTMGALGYDAVTAGDHEFDYKGTGFAQMLSAAVLSGDRVPALLMSNYRPSADNPDRLDIQRAMAVYGVRDYMLLERGGVICGVFGLMGEDSHGCAPTSGFTLEDRVESARRCVDALKEQGAQLIVCLSHSGTDEKEKKSEDEQLAKRVEGIDLIVSGHTHTTLAEPIVAGDTYIVSAGPYCEKLGSITLTWSGDGDKILDDYRLIPIDETVPEDPETASLAEGWKSQVSGGYLARYGLSYDQPLTTGGFALELPEGGVQEGSALGELVADSFLWAAEHLEAGAPNVDTVAVTAAGALCAGLPAGEITTSMAFDALSMGVGADGASGFPLVGVYLTGRELKAAAEADASVAPIMPAAQLYMSGMKYSFNTHRMFFNRVTQARLSEAPFVNSFTAAGLTEIEEGRLYRVVTGLYSARMLGAVKSKSLGLLSLEPKMADGSPVADFSDCILRDKNGNELKEWYALAAYLQSFGAEGMPDWYSRPDGRKDVSRSWAPIQLLKNPNWITLVTLLALVLAALAAVLMVRALARRRRRRRYGGGHRRRFGR